MIPHNMSSGIVGHLDVGRFEIEAAAWMLLLKLFTARSKSS